MDFNIFEGMECHGVPLVTISRGKVVWENQKVHSSLINNFSFLQLFQNQYLRRDCVPVFDAIERPTLHDTILAINSFF